MYIIIIVNRGLAQELSSQHQHISFTVTIFANEHDADDTWLHLTLDGSPKVIFTGSCLSTWCTKHLLHKTGKQICFIINSSGVGIAQGQKTAQSLLGGKAEPPITFQQQRPVCQTRVWDDDRSAPSAFPLSQYMKETLQWFYRDGNSKHQLLKHPVRTGLCFWNQYLIVERHGRFWPHGLKL